MNVVVLLAGIADPKWPLVAASKEPHEARAENHMVFSPFDEAALETALKIRDGHPETTLTAILTGGTESDALARKVAAHRPERTLRLDSSVLSPWDARACARQLATTLDGLGEPADLLLLGREFGDFDNGALPPSLAATLGWPFFGLTQHVVWENGRLRLMREQGAVEEWTSVTGPTIASVTNDRRNRLRHPLMKNVMMAKKVEIPVLSASGPVPARLDRMATAAAPPPSRDVACRILAGPLDEQITRFVAFLEPWRPSR